MKDFQSHLVYFKEIISYMQIVLKVNQIKNGKCIKVLCNQKQNPLTWLEIKSSIIPLSLSSWEQMMVKYYPIRFYMTQNSGV